MHRDKVVGGRKFDRGPISQKLRVRCAIRRPEAGGEVLQWQQNLAVVEGMQQQARATVMHRKEQLRLPLELPPGTLSLRSLDRGNLRPSANRAGHLFSLTRRLSLESQKGPARLGRLRIWTGRLVHRLSIVAGTLVIARQRSQRRMEN